MSDLVVVISAVVSPKMLVRLLFALRFPDLKQSEVLKRYEIRLKRDVVKRSYLSRWRR